MTSPRNDAASERDAKTARLTRILRDHDRDALHLTSSASLAWLLGGARTAVPLGGPPVLSATVARDGALVVTTLANEVDRLADEEAPDVAWRVIPWHGDLAAAPAGALTEGEAAAELRHARAALLPAEVARYRALGADTARALRRALERALPGWTERELAAEIAREAYLIGAEPAVILAAGSARENVPHPLPTHAPLGGRAMAVVTMVRHGLHASATRWVEFDADGRRADTEAALREVEADAFRATRRGRTVAAVLADIAAAYPRHGFAERAWEAHHQGGATGYAGRDPKASPALSDRVTSPQAFAWNPWVPGAKVEDTVLVSEGEVEVLTADPEWPTTVVAGRPRPLPLARHAARSD
ncbi:M24 family metallopeptidase [Microbacterium excoecariae]|uniref:M24 family metallopeptidase n=1 Tax=Microbacterium excoecariae TaxID=2715210 RepID=UPI00140B1C77|nr:M24 family metallopeptidase [Microbacterium excoecariae]NHI17405.1 M24 family metallopeptidase [Microbacterium excoecariae]